MNLDELFERLMDLNIDERSIEEANLSEITDIINAIEFAFKIIDILNDLISKDTRLSPEERNNQKEFILRGNETLHYLYELASAKREFLFSLN